MACTTCCEHVKVIAVAHRSALKGVPKEDPDLAVGRARVNPAPSRRPIMSPTCFRCRSKRPADPQIVASPSPCLRSIAAITVFCRLTAILASDRSTPLRSVGGGHLDVENVDPREFFEKNRLAFHYRLRGERPDVAEAQDRGRQGLHAPSTAPPPRATPGE